MAFFRRKKKRGLGREYGPGGIRFFLEASPPLRFPLSQNRADVFLDIADDIQVLQHLNALWQEGLLQESGGNSWLLSYAVFGLLLQEEDGKEIAAELDLPYPEEIDLQVDTLHHVGSDQFGFTLSVSHSGNNWQRLPLQRYQEGVFFLGKTRILPLETKAARLVDVILEGPVTSGEDPLYSRMVWLAKVRDAAMQAHAQLGTYLQNESYSFFDTATLDFEQKSPEEILLKPCLDDGEAITAKEEQHRFIPGPGGRRNRRILSPELVQTVRELPEDLLLKGSDVPRFLTNPEQIIPEGLDLSLFSERVKGFRTRVYNSRPYLHVERSEEGGWFDGIPKVSLEDISPDVGEEEFPSPPPSLSPETLGELVREAKEKGDPFVLSGDHWIQVDPSANDEMEKITRDFEKDERGRLRIPAGMLLDIHDNLKDLEFSGTIDMAELRHWAPAPQPDSLQAILYPYQLDGYQWMNRIAKEKRGGLLADDMGLGKTIQVISHMLHIKECGEEATHLVVVPKSLIENWKREIARFSGGLLSCYVHDGPQRARICHHLDPYDVVLLTYDTLRRDQVTMAAIDWYLVVCDEAQYAKNPTTQRTTAVKALKARHRIALSGTPVENGLIEFWCIMDFVQPGLLGSWADFRTRYERPIVSGNSEEEIQITVENLLQKIQGYYKRRMKRDVLENLPECREKRHFCEMSALQLARYRLIAEEGTSGGKGAALAAIGKLLRLSAHPAALGNDDIRQMDLLALSPKLQRTCQLLEEIQQKNEKVILFSDFKRVQQILQWAIQKTLGIYPDIINGDVNRNRQDIIDIFSKKPGFHVLILGHQVAGVGLNITAANHVIHYTRPWNPAKEQQATDRAYRIGQERDVVVHYPVVRHPAFTTVEMKLDSLLAGKKSLAENVLRPSRDQEVRKEELMSCLNLSVAAEGVACSHAG